MLDTFEVNKILGAVLGTFLGIQAVHLMAGAVFAPQIPAKPGFEIEVKETPASEPAAAPKEEPFAPLLASASVERGQAATKPCEVCHTFEKGGPNRVGPNLWGVVNRPRASEAGFNYSAAMKSKGGTWTYDELNKFLANPRRDIPGTAMTFAGIDRERQRADVVAYLRTLSDNPAPLPQAAQSSEESKSDSKTDAQGGGDAKGNDKGGTSGDAKGNPKGDTSGDAKGNAK
jgi:cytochrome c